MCSLCGKRYFTVTALKKHHAMHGEGGLGAVGGNKGSTSGGIGGSGGSSSLLASGSGGGSDSSGLATMDIEMSSKLSAKASASDSAADQHSDDDDDASAIDASILEIDGLTQV